jgi:(p)ppGpp synthase/HD superfamily hydrolase
MHSYAQTNVQLFNQLRSEGYSKEERERVRQAYEFAMRLFTGLFLPSGRPFIDHLVGTASILASLHVSVELVTAGLIHAAYQHGDFGGIEKGILEAKRKQVRNAVGGDVEAYVARYDRLLWNLERILILRGALDELDPIDRNVLLMRLANELEHNLDLGVLYFFRSEKQQKWHQGDIERYGPIMRDMSERLGFSSLSAEIERVFRNVTLAQLPITPWIRNNQKVPYLVAPKSYRERFCVTFCRKFFFGYRLASRILNRAKLLCSKPYKFMRKLLRTVS